MPSKEKATYGSKNKKCAWLLLEAIIAWANDQLTEVKMDGSPPQWEELEEEDKETKKKTKKYTLRIKTNLKSLKRLTEKYNPHEELKIEKIRELLKVYFGKESLNILTDNRFYKKGNNEWDFTLTLWNRWEKEKNFKQFDIEWERIRSEKSKQQEEMLRETLALETPLLNYEPLARQDWGEAPDVSVFFGRTQELVTLEKWILEDRCRLIAIVGMGGIGKTSLPLKLGKGGIGKTDLSLKLAQGITEEFDYLIWRNLKNSPPLKEILSDLIKILSNQREINLPEKEEKQISKILDYLKESRTLVILDNAESILKKGEGSGQYREGYEGYGELLIKVGETSHKSCLLLTSREKPQNISRKAGKSKPVRFLELEGVNYEDGRKIVEATSETKGSFYGSDDDWEQLIKLYNGNPLALELAGKHIQEVFNCDITEFLQRGKHIFGEPLEKGQDERDDMRKLLDWHFNRLSALEQEILYWLAINQIAVSAFELKKDLLSSEAKNNISTTLQCLQRRLPLEKVGTRFTLQPVILEYITEHYIEKIVNEITENNLKIVVFNQYALIKALSNEYVMQDQIKLILSPLAEQLKEKSLNNVENLLLNILCELHKNFKNCREGYATGNLINLLLHLKIDLTDYDFSHLRIRQAYLQEHTVKGVNFSYCNLSDSVFSEDFGTITSIDFINDIAVAGTTSGDIHLWQIKEEKRLNTFKGHSDWVWGVAFSPNGDYLASAGGDKTVRLWNIKTGDLIQIWSEHNARIRGLAFSPKADLIASGDELGEIRLWNLVSSQFTKAFRFEQKVWANAIAFSPDGSMLAVGSQATIIKLWDVSSGQEIKEFKDYENPIRSIVFSPDGSLIAIAGDALEIWLVDTKSWKCKQKLSGYEGWIRDISFSADSKMLASAGADKTIRIWNIETSDCIQTMQGHRKPARSIAFQNKTVLSGSEDQTIRLWDANSGECLRAIQGHTNPVWSIALSPTGLLVASGDEDSFIRLWDISQKDIPKDMTKHRLLGNHNNLVRTLAFNSNGSLLASGSYDGTVKVWQLSDGNSVKLSSQKKPDGSMDRVISVAFSPVDSIIAISYYYGEKVNLWNFETRQLIDTLSIKNYQGKKVRSRAVAFSQDGRILAISSEENYIRLWDMQTKQYLKPLKDHKDAVWSVSFNPNGKILASCDGNGSIRLWNLETYESKELESHTQRTRAIAFSPDGKKLVSGSDDKTLKIWNTDSGECLATLEGHQSWIWSVAFSYNNKIVASSSEDNTVKIWSVELCDCISTLRPYRRYERMNITGVIGFENAQKEMLKNLGAFEE